MSICADCSHTAVILEKNNEGNDRIHYVKCKEGLFTRRLPIHSEILRFERDCPHYQTMSEGNDDLNDFLRSLPRTKDEYNDWRRK